MFRVHEEALEDGGLSGIVNEDAVLSAIARPYHGYHRFIYQKAAALLHGVISSHGFIDGNKRTALYLVELMVERSGYEFVEEDMVIVEVITSVARAETSYKDLAEWFRGRLIRVR